MSIDFSTDLGGGGGGEDDLDRLLQEEEEQQTPDGGGDERKDDKGEGGADDAALKRANELLAQQLADSQKRIADLEQNRQRFSTTLEEKTKPPQPQAIDRSKLKEELAKQLVDDPGEAMIRVFESARQAAIAEMQGQVGSIAQGSASLEINAYRSEKAVSDPAYKDIEAEFDALASDPNTAQQLAGLQPAARRQALDFLYDAASGRALRKKSATDTRDRQPPAYGGGQTFSTGTATPSNYKGKPLNPTQREILRVARESGINDPKRIRAMLDDAANEG